MTEKCLEIINVTSLIYLTCSDHVIEDTLVDALSNVY